MVVDIEKIKVKDDRIRKDFGDIQELADDIRQNGLINPPVVNKEYLAYPYRTTKKGNFVSAIKDIEAWVPKNGIAGLMKEADDNALARKIAKEQGY